MALIRAILRGGPLPATELVPVTRFELDFVPERPDLPIYLAALGRRCAGSRARSPTACC